jgi:hypothetical protein
LVLSQILNKRLRENVVGGFFKRKRNAYGGFDGPNNREREIR